MSGACRVELAVPDELLERLATQVAALVRERDNESASGAETPSPWLTVKEAATYLGCSRHALYRLTASKAIPFRKRVGGQSLLFRRDELDGWVESHYSREGVPV